VGCIKNVKQSKMSQSPRWCGGYRCSESRKRWRRATQLGEAMGALCCSASRLGKVEGSAGKAWEVTQGNPELYRAIAAGSWMCDVCGPEYWSYGGRS
jgi:hypothetical protein